MPQLFLMVLQLAFSLFQQLNQDLELDETRSFRRQVGSPITNSPPGMWVIYYSFSLIADAVVFSILVLIIIAYFFQIISFLQLN